MHNQKNNIFKKSCSALLSAALLSGFILPSSQVFANEQINEEIPIIFTDESTGNIYKITKDNENERIVKYVEDGIEGTVIYDKIQKKLTVSVLTQNGIQTIYINTEGPTSRSVYSPWGYSKNGNKYTLTAFINGKTVSKTRTKSSNNSGWITSFCNAIDDMVSIEWQLTGKIGVNVISAILSGGFSTVASVLAMGGLYQQGVSLNQATSRAKKAYLNIA